MLRVLAAALLILGPSSALAGTPARPPLEEANADQRPPALTVLLVVDQLSGDFLDKHAATLTGGLGRLLREGVVYQDARHAAAPNVTACGHAAIATGAYGSVHGIGGNDWFDREHQKLVYCVEDPAFHMLGRPAQPHDGTAPAYLKVGTLADTFKASNPAAKVVALAVKDRAAILLGGHRPDAALWFDRGLGRFNTSSFYGEKVPAWADAENQVLAAYREKGFTWKRTAASAGMVDDQPYEGTTRGLGAVFPHESKVNATVQEFSHRFTIMAEADRSLLRLAQAAVEGAQLGADDVGDLLLISLSANDFILHSFGPDSAEAVESLASIDAGLEELFALLERKVGRDRLVIALTADHGGAPAPEAARAMGLGGGRLDPKKLEQEVESGLSEKFHVKKEWLRAFTESGVYLLDEGDVDFEQVKSEAARIIARQEGVSQVLRRGHPEEWLLSAEGRAAAKGYSRPNGGDLVLMLAPYWIFAGDVASHFTSYAYDARVPLVVRAPGRRPRRIARRVQPADLPGTLAALSGLPPPPVSEGHLLREVMEVSAGSRRDAAPRSAGVAAGSAP